MVLSSSTTRQIGDLRSVPSAAGSSNEAAAWPSPFVWPHEELDPACSVMAFLRTPQDRYRARILAPQHTFLRAILCRFARNLRLVVARNFIGSVRRSAPEMRS